MVATKWSKKDIAKEIFGNKIELDVEEIKIKLSDSIDLIFRKYEDNEIIVIFHYECSKNDDMLIPSDRLSKSEISSLAEFFGIKYLPLAIIESDDLSEEQKLKILVIMFPQPVPGTIEHKKMIEWGENELKKLGKLK